LFVTKHGFEDNEAPGNFDAKKFQETRSPMRYDISGSGGLAGQQDTTATYARVMPVPVACSNKTPLREQANHCSCSLDPYGKTHCWMLFRIGKSIFIKWFTAIIQVDSKLNVVPGRVLLKLIQKFIPIIKIPGIHINYSTVRYVEPTFASIPLLLKTKSTLREARN